MYLPKISGMDVLNTVKADNACPRTKFAMMTGDGSGLE